MICEAAAIHGKKSEAGGLVFLYSMWIRAMEGLDDLTNSHHEPDMEYESSQQRWERFSGNGFKIRTCSKLHEVRLPRHDT